MASTDLALSPSGLRKARQRTIDTLTQAFANDDLNVDEFEKRVALAHEITDPVILSTLLADLPEEHSLAAQDNTHITSDTSQHTSLVRAEDSKKLYAVLGSLERKGQWTPALHNKVISVTGRAHIDLREANLSPGITTLRITGFFSDIKIIVPKHVRVECEGSGILGQFDFHPLSSEHPNPDAPIVRITGWVVGGKVRVIVDEGLDKPYAIVKKIASWIDKNMT